MNQEQTETLLKQHCSITLTIALVPKSANHLVIVIYQKQKPCTGILKSVQDFLIKLDIKPLMHLLEKSTFSLNNVIGRLTKIMNRADKNWAHF